MCNSEYSFVVITNSPSFSNPFRVCCRRHCSCEIGWFGEVQFKANAIGDLGWCVLGEVRQLDGKR